MREFLTTLNSTLRVVSPHDTEVFHDLTDINNLYARGMFAPAAVVIPKTVEEVQQAVKVSQICSAPAFTIVSGGHNAAGYNLNSGGVVLNFQEMTFLKVDKENLVMTAQSGVRWSAVYPQLNNTGIGVTGGGCSHVGVAGFTLGGGWSWLSRSYGLASDNLLNAKIVLANGTLISVNKHTAARNSDVADLWFALRGGGGGNFGVLVELQMKLHDTKQVVTYNGTTIKGAGLAGEMCWSLTRSKENATLAMKEYGKWMVSMPDAMTGAVIMTTWALPTIEHLRTQGYLSRNSAETLAAGIAQSKMKSDQSKEKAFCITHIYNGQYEDGLELLLPMLELSPDLAESNNRTLSDMDLPSYEQIIGEGAATAQNGNFYTNSRFFDHGNYDEYLIDKIINGVLESPGDLDTVVFHVGGGAIASVPENETAFGHRKAFILMQAKAIWEDSDNRSEHIEWTDGLIKAVSNHSMGSYVNYMNPDMQDWEVQYYGLISSKRLHYTKNTFDPYNFFNFPLGFVANETTTRCPGGWDTLPSSSRPDGKQVVRCRCGPYLRAPAKRNRRLENSAQPGEVYPFIGLRTGGAAPHIPGEPELPPGVSAPCWRDDCPDGGQTVEDAIYNWLVIATDDTTGRRVDDAIIYGHPNATGSAIKRATADGELTRDQIYYSTKVGGLRAMGYADTLAQAKEILAQTGLDYVDMLLVHYPKSAASSSDPYCNTKSSMYNERECRLSTWRAMVELYHTGITRAIGVSNYDVSHIVEIASAGLQLPSINQLPFSPHRNRGHATMRQLCTTMGITLVGYSTFYGGDALPPAIAPSILLANPLVKSIAKKYNRSTAQVIVAWSLSLGVPVNPRTTNVSYMKDTADVARDWMAGLFSLDESELLMLSRLPEATCDLDPLDYRCAPTYTTCPPSTCEKPPCPTDISGTCNAACIALTGPC
jgi:diketogulonate reductase-like aldo/keto reductase